MDAGRAQLNKKLRIRSKRNLDKLLNPLRAMIGCRSVKEQIESLVYFAYVNALRKKKKIKTVSPNLHAAFLGAPGTGKTTVARLYSNILFNLGYLSKGHVVEVTRADLVAGYIGQTAPRVRAYAEAANGGVLFIDEAYSLGADKPSEDFGAEAIAELIQSMENNRENMVVILAGYTDQMEKLLSSNPGLRSRIPNLIGFPDYSYAELVKIFAKFCHDSQYHPTNELLARLEVFLRALDKATIAHMGNARGIRNIFEESLMLQSRRIMKQKKFKKSALMILEAEDLYIPSLSAAIDDSPGHTSG